MLTEKLGLEKTLKETESQTSDWTNNLFLMTIRDTGYPRPLWSNLLLQLRQ